MSFRLGAFLYKRTGSFFDVFHVVPYASSDGGSGKTDNSPVSGALFGLGLGLFGLGLGLFGLGLGLFS